MCIRDRTEEVASAKWCTIDEIRDMQKNGELAPSIDIYLDMFINLLNYEFLHRHYNRPT